MPSTECSASNAVAPTRNYLANQAEAGPSNAGPSNAGPSAPGSSDAAIPSTPWMYTNQQIDFNDFIEVEIPDKQQEPATAPPTATASDDYYYDEDEDDEKEAGDDVISYPSSLKYSSSEEGGRVNFDKLQRRIDWCRNKIGRSQAAQAVAQATDAADEGTSRKRKRPENEGDEVALRKKKFLRLYGATARNFLKVMEYSKARGFVYGFLLEDNSPVSSTSNTLQDWWNQEVRFDHYGPAEAQRYYRLQNPLSITPADIANNPPKPIYEMLMELSDGTLGSLMSATMQHCDPPQRKFPLEKGVPPAWWPTEVEDWWGPTGVPADITPPPYRKPHDIKKKFKAVVIIAIIKHISPNFSKLMHMVQQSKSLQDRLTSKENNTWNSVLKEEVKSYCRDHPEVPLETILSSFQGISGLGFSDSGGNVPQGGNLNREGDGIVVLDGRVKFVCEHPRCLYNNPHYGFTTHRARDEHQTFCGFRQSGTEAPQVSQSPPGFKYLFPILPNHAIPDLQSTQFPSSMAPGSSFTFPMNTEPVNQLPEFGGLQFRPVNPPSTFAMGIPPEVGNQFSEFGGLHFRPINNPSTFAMGVPSEPGNQFLDFEGLQFRSLNPPSSTFEMGGPSELGNQFSEFGGLQFQPLNPPSSTFEMGGPSEPGSQFSDFGGLQFHPVDPVLAHTIPEFGGPPPPQHPMHFSPNPLHYQPMPDIVLEMGSSSHLANNPPQLDAYHPGSYLEHLNEIHNNTIFDRDVNPIQGPLNDGASTSQNPGFGENFNFRNDGASTSQHLGFNENFNFRNDGVSNSQNPGFGENINFRNDGASTSQPPGFNENFNFRDDGAGSSENPVFNENFNFRPVNQPLDTLPLIDQFNQGWNNQMNNQVNNANNEQQVQNQGGNINDDHLRDPNFPIYDFGDLAPHG